MAIATRHALTLLLLAGLWLAMLVLGGGPLDREVYLALYSGGHPALVAAARLVSEIGQPTAMVAIGAVAAAAVWWFGRPRLAAAMVAIMLTGRGLELAQKYWIGRPRPDLDPHLVAVRTSSFPSGHSANSMIVGLTLALVLAYGPRVRAAALSVALLLALAIGTSRVMLGVHWPSDVIGGWSFGALWVLATLKRAERLFRSETGAA